jgi:RNA polymerase sigma-70 factor (ECF subfamily)
MNPPPQSQPYPSAVEGSTQGARAPKGLRGPADGSADVDLALVRRMQAGDEQALGAFYDRWFPVVSGAVGRILKSDGDVEDVIEETFWQAWRQADRFVAGRGSVQTWLLTIARSRALDRLRAAKRRREESLDEPGELDAASPTVADAPATSTSDPSLAVEHAERRRLVLAALADLPSEQRQALELGYFGGLSQTEIAEQTGQPLGTVKTRMRLAMQKLRERLSVLREDTR